MKSLARLIGLTPSGPIGDDMSALVAACSECTSLAES